MSIASAAAEIRRAESEGRSRGLHRAQLRLRQEELDHLIGQLEELALAGADETPAELRQDVVAALENVHGKQLPWLRPLSAPLQLMDHVFVAEGLLRQRYYKLDDFALSESA